MGVENYSVPLIKIYIFQLYFLLFCISYILPRCRPLKAFPSSEPMKGPANTPLLTPVRGRIIIFFNGYGNMNRWFVFHNKSLETIVELKNGR